MHKELGGAAGGSTSARPSAHGRFSSGTSTRATTAPSTSLLCASAPPLGPCRTLSRSLRYPVLVLLFLAGRRRSTPGAAARPACVSSAGAGSEAAKFCRPIVIFFGGR